MIRQEENLDFSKKSGAEGQAPNSNRIAIAWLCYNLKETIFAILCLTNLISDISQESHQNLDQKYQANTKK